MSASTGQGDGADVQPWLKALIGISAPFTFYPPVTIRANNEIRILNLLPGELEQDIRCDLSVLSLQDAESVSPEQCYTALSYTWGSWQNKQEICLDGLSHFPITYNLWTALRRLRSTTQTQKLWIDQICINQRDLEERRQQVRLMGKVYEKASDVKVWLGDASDLPWLRSKCPRTEAGDALYKVMVLQEVTRSAQPRWWDRAWVVQEFVTAADEPMVCFGDCRKPWSELNTLRDMDPFPDAMMFQLETVSFFRDLRFGESLVRRNLALLGHIMAATESTDPRDGVYSLLNLITPEEADLITIDYNENVAMVFGRATYASIAVGHTLQILSLICSGRLGRPRELPSWVVDPTFEGVHLKEANEVMEYAPLFYEPPLPWCKQQPTRTADVQFDLLMQTILVKGLVFDKIRWTLSLTEGEGSGRFKMTQKESEHVRSVIGSLGLPPSHDILAASSGRAANKHDLQWTFIAASFSALFAHLTTGSDCVLVRIVVKEVFAAWFHTMDMQQKESEDGSIIDNIAVVGGWPTYLHFISRSLVFFMTDSGFMGLGPGNAKQGDTIALLSGARAPAILRSSDTDWRFISFAFVNGIMARELLEALPDAQFREVDFCIV